MNTDIYKSIDYSKLNEHLNSLSNKKKRTKYAIFSQKTSTNMIPAALRN